MRLSVFGLGYVGCVSAGCFARAGHDVLGVDINQMKVNLINAGKSPIVETAIGELIDDVVARGKLRATTESVAAVATSEISLICVGTPGNSDGSTDLRYVKRVCEEIGRALKDKRERHTVVVRSTVLPDAVETVIVPTLELSAGKKAGRDFGVCVNPEFLREGTSVQDFYSPPFTLIGAEDEEVAAVVRQLYAQIQAPVLVVSIKSAEMIKYACNSFHALKISFSNEIGSFCKRLGIDSHQVMDALCRDTKLNLSPYYLTPGFAFGGSCLPKDLRALTHKAKQMDVDVPVLSAVLRSNRQQIDRAVKMVLETGKRRVGLLGLSFKAGTDDLRESPAVTLVEVLISNGLEITIYDPNVMLTRLVGANKQYLERTIPAISQLMRDNIEDVVTDAEVLIIANEADEFREVESKLRSHQVVIDLVRLFRHRMGADSYQGICW